MRFGAVVAKVLLPALISPLLAGVVALTATRLVYRIVAHIDRDLVGGGFQRAQWASSSLVALAHGTNDAQKTMGIITLTLITAGALPVGSGPPSWVVLAAGLAIALGTFTGGWRIIQTLGLRVSEIAPPQGFVAETSSTAVILAASGSGLPLSTTQVCTGSVFGAGAGRNPLGVRWAMALRMALAWAITLPAAALVGAGASWLASTGTWGIVAVAGLSMAVVAGIYAMSRRNPVSARSLDQRPVRVAA